MRLHCRVSEQVEEDPLLVGDSAPTDNLTDEANTSSLSSSAAASASVRGVRDTGDVTSHSDAANMHCIGLSTSVQSSVTLAPSGILISTT